MFLYYRKRSYLGLCIAVGIITVLVTVTPLHGVLLSVIGVLVGLFAGILDGEIEIRRNSSL